MRKLHLHTAHWQRVKQSAWYLADNAANADADTDIHHRSAEAQAEPSKLGRPRRMADSAKCCELQATTTTTTTKASQFFCSKHKKISWQLQEKGLELGWRERTGKEIGTETGMRIAVCECAWQRHWHKSLDRKRCKPCCAHNNFYVAIKRRLLPRRFVCPFGFWLLAFALPLPLPLHSMARDEAIAN